MRDQEIIGLWEAYQQVHSQPEEVEQLEEGRNTSLQALSRESEQRKADKKRGRPETESETHSRLMMGKFRPGASQKERAEGGRQVLRDRGKVPKKGGKDMFEHILEHLVAEGYADTNEAALAIMANMSEEWRQSIVEDFPNVLNFPRQGGSRSGDAGTRGLTKTPTGYINRHSRGDDLPEPTVNKIMGGNLMVKNQNKKSDIQTA
jgi:hypothetical protein